MRFLQRAVFEPSKGTLRLDQRQLVAVDGSADVAASYPSRLSPTSGAADLSRSRSQTHEVTGEPYEFGCCLARIDDARLGNKFRRVGRFVSTRPGGVETFQELLHIAIQVIERRFETNKCAHGRPA